ncbi:hypothetical protein ACFV0T_16705, partial [Streptomyces sp. NPDC059582]
MESLEPPRCAPPADRGPGAVFVCRTAVPARRPPVSRSRLGRPVAALPGARGLPGRPALPGA